MALTRRRSSAWSYDIGSPGAPPKQSRWEFRDDEWVLFQDDGEEVNLVYSKQEKVPFKDFGAEVRAEMDMDQFLSRGVVLLDVAETGLEPLLDALLNKLALSIEEHQFHIGEIKGLLIAHDSAQLLSRTMQAMTGTEGSSFEYDQSWLCTMCSLPTLQRRHVCIARLKHPSNFGTGCHEVRLFILVLCPSKEKGTKNALETGRTFSTIFSDMEFRQTLLEAATEEEFKDLIIKQSKKIAQQQGELDAPIEMKTLEAPAKERWFRFGTGIKEDLQRRLPHYLSDYKDGIVGPRAIQKTISTTAFLYFACILPAIAFGVLNDHTTGGKIDVKKTIAGAAFGEGFFAIFSGQPLNVLLTTAPLSLFVKIVFALAQDFNVPFETFYACVGICCSIFTVLFALLDVSRIMKWSSRSSEEIFALFISIAFCLDAFKDFLLNYQHNYNSPQCTALANNFTTFVVGHGVDINGTEYTVSSVLHNGTAMLEHIGVSEGCHRDSSLLFLLLMFGTLWLGLTLYNFNKTPYLQAGKREALADYALPVAVVVLSFVGSFVFREVKQKPFNYDAATGLFKMAPLNGMNWPAIALSIGLGFCLALLILMDQNISSALVNNPSNKLKKGPAYHWDLLTVSVVNVFMSLFTWPWMHVALPHGTLHMRSLADVEERVDQGHVHEIIVRVRETRLAAISAHVLIGLSLFLLPYPLSYIPTAVLDGLFLYMAITSLNGLQIFERITLLFMEQAAYPPTHYIRRVPQRKIHQFTACQVVQLGLLCAVGFVPWPYVKMAFPIVLLAFLPIRHLVIPRIIGYRYLQALDGDN